jgi:hypothetical protein
MKKWLVVSLVAATSVLVNAQTAPIATANSKLAWTIAAPDLATSQSYIYKYYPDASATGTNLVSVACTGTVSPFACEVAFPLFTQGNHTLRLSASNAAGEGTPSAPFAFAFVGKPATPGSITIK